MTGLPCHQLDNMQIICTSLQTDNHTSTSSLNITGRMFFLTPNQQRQSTERNLYLRKDNENGKILTPMALKPQIQVIFGIYMYVTSMTTYPGYTVITCQFFQTC